MLRKTKCFVCFEIVCFEKMNRKSRENQEILLVIKINEKILNKRNKDEEKILLKAEIAALGLHKLASHDLFNKK